MALRTAPVALQFRRHGLSLHLWANATRSATPAATRDATAPSDGRSSAGLGGTSRRRSRSGLARPGITAKPRSILRANGERFLSAGIGRARSRPEHAEQRLTWLTKVLELGKCEVIKVY